MAEHWHLFLDDHDLARSTGFDRVVHHPRPLGVVIPADRPWETAGVAPLYVGRQPDGTWLAYYTAMWWDCEAGTRQDDPGFARDRAHHIFSRIALATSSDGLHWEKPALGLVEAPATTEWESHAPFPSPAGTGTANNLGVPYVVVADLGSNGNVGDPDRRFALRLAPGEAGVGAAWAQAPNGFFAAELPDFRGDPDWQRRLTPCGGSFEPRRRLLHFWDDLHREWVAMEQGVTGHWIPSREIARFSSPDLNAWESRAVLYPDAADPHFPHSYDEPMSMTPFCAEGVVFGLLSWFHSDRTHPDGGPVFDPTPEHPHRWPWCRKGTNEMRITLSRDGGLTWDRTSSREAWIPHGQEEDSYDRLVIGALPPVPVGEEDWFFAQVISGDHLITRNTPEQLPYYHHRLPRHQVALYVQRRHRYVGMRAAYGREVLITRPVMVAGERLELNVDAGHGRVRVGLAAADPIPTFDGTTPAHAPHLLPAHQLPGFSLDECRPIDADSICEPVAFKGNLAGLAGRKVHLLIEAERAEVYGFRWA